MSYQIEYQEFLNNYNKGLVDAKVAGAMVAKLASLFASANLEYTQADIKFNVKLAETLNTVDLDSGKYPSAAKATVDAEASEEFKEKAIKKAHMINLEVLVNASKTLQRGLMNEQGMAGNL